jgi:drug/metabolite transporter (DMT)-like permease
MVLFGFLWLGESAGWRDLLVLGFQMIGVVLILVVELQGTAVAGVIFGLLAGLTYALVQLSLRWMRDQDPAWLVAVNHVVTVLVLLPFVARFGQRPEGIQWLLLAMFGMLQMGLPYLLFARGLQALSTHEAAGIVLLEPVLVPCWVYLAWSQTDHYVSPGWSTFVGGRFILLGLLMRCWSLKLKTHNKPRSTAQDNDARCEAEQRDQQ